MGGVDGTMREGSGAFRILVGRPEWKWQPGRPRFRWYYNMKMILQEVRCGIAWIDLFQNRDRWL